MSYFGGLACYTFQMNLLSPTHPAFRNLDDLPRLPLDQSVPTHVLSRRRHAISSACDSPYRSRPRMKRRGAISYDHSDACAVYIRYLGEALAHKDRHPDGSSVLVPFSQNDTFKLSAVKRRGRRGSMHSNSPAEDFNLHLKGSVLQAMGVDQLASTEQNNLGNIDSWDFDVFAFRRMTKGRPLLNLGLYLFHHHNLLEAFQLDIMKLRKFLCLVEDCYHPDNCYHNCVHASDVAQALHCLISDPMIYPSLTPLEVLTLLLAAFCHDVDHPGVNQNYLVNTSSYLAALHGTQSLLERHHCHSAKAAVQESQLIAHLPADQRQEIMTLMEDLILATDVTRHQDFVAHFEGRLVSENKIDMSNQVDRHFIMMMAIKAADISNPARRLPISKMWSENIMEEFFRQGDSERALNLPVSHLCDRRTTAIPKAQSGFFEFVALPLFKAWSQFVHSPLSLRLCQNILTNKAYWDKQISSPCSSDSEEER